MGVCGSHEVLQMSSCRWKWLFLLQCDNACHCISSPALRPDSKTNHRHSNYISHCVIVFYRLCYCSITDEGCAALASALRSNPSHLRELDLSGNILEQSGVKLLSDVKDDPHYKLETLYYCKCFFKLLQSPKFSNRPHMCVTGEFKMIIQFHFSLCTLNSV